MLEQEVKDYFNNWEDNPYVSGKHNCKAMSFEVEEYWETVKGYDCYIVYGSNLNPLTAHMWTIIKIDGNLYEFESTCLSFQSESNKYQVDDVQHGHYINGVYYNMSQPYPDWEEDLKELI